MKKINLTTLNSLMVQKIKPLSIKEHEEKT